MDRIQEEKKISIDVNCLGDSLTYSYGGNGITYPGTLQALLGREYQVNNLGIGGENTVTIAGRQGSIPMLVKAVTIPAETAIVEIAFLENRGEVPKPLRQGEAGINPCYLKGIKGELSITQSTTVSEDARWYFTREKEGEPVKIGEGEVLVTSASLSKRKGIVILWTGTNDRLAPPAEEAAKVLAEKQKLMIDYIEETDKKYIVLGLTHLTTMDSRETDSLNRELEGIYGDHFLDIRRKLLQSGLKAFHREETAQDSLDISQGNVPGSLRVDDVHLNSSGYMFIGQQVFQKGVELGYWK